MNKRQRKKIRHSVYVVTGGDGIIFGVHRSLRAASEHSAMLGRQLCELGHGERKIGTGIVNIRMGDILDWESA